MGKKSVKTCFICASTISRSSEERFKGTNVNTSRKILLKYLLKNRDKSETLYNTIENYVSKDQKDFCSVQFCASCDQRAEKVGRLLLKLSTIQKNIDEEIEETRKTVGNASKTISNLPDTDGATRAKTKFLYTLRNFQKCVGNKIESNANKQEIDSSLSPVEIIHIDDSRIKSESHETTVANNEIVPQPENTSANEEVIHDSTEEDSSNESNDEDEYTVDYIKVEDEDDCIMVEHDNDDQDLSDEEEEEIIDCSTDLSIPSSPIDPLSFDDSEDSDCIEITENNDGSHTRPPPPPPIVEVPNKASSPNFSKESASQIHASSSASAYSINTNPSMEKVRRLAPHSSRNIPRSTVVPLQNPHHILQQYVVVTPLQSADGRALPPPKVVPWKYKLPPEVKNAETTRKLMHLQAPSRTITVEPQPPKPKQIILYEQRSETSGSNSEVHTFLKCGKKRPLYRCKLCSAPVMKSNIVFEHHLRTHETSTKNYTCSMCKIQFTTKQMHDFHKKFHNVVYSTKCNICSQTVRILDMKGHVETCHKVNPISCPYCSQYFGKYRGLLCHMQHHRGVPIKCVICPDSVFKTRKLLGQHFIEFHEIDEDDVVIKCDVPECAAKFFGEQYKSLHMHRHRKTYECPTCGKCCISPSTLAEHLKIHTEEGHCDLCPGKSFGSDSALLTHQRREHGVAKIQCDQCVKTFFHKGGLLHHQRRSHGNGDFKIKMHPCPTCGKKLTTKVTLKNHMLTHSDNKDFICSECGFQTRSKELLKDHQLRHFGEKTHQCPYCPKVFLKSDILKVHVRVHTKERPYVCDICGSDFNQRSAMVTHKRRHDDATFVPRASKIRKKD